MATLVEKPALHDRESWSISKAQIKIPQRDKPTAFKLFVRYRIPQWPFGRRTVTITLFTLSKTASVAAIRDRQISASSCMRVSNIAQKCIESKINIMSECPNRSGCNVSITVITELYGYDTGKPQC
jgi:hypothetical protein